MHRLGALARQTPQRRERYVDLLRAIAITAVVLGHWLVTAIGRDADGELTGRSALPELPWAQPVTWLVQVLPIFFLVGGYANAASLRSRYRRGGDATGWLVDRAGRLVRPTTVLVLVLTATALLTRLLATAGIGPFPPAPESAELVRSAVWFATVPLWFLTAYLAVVALTPPMYALHRRLGLGVPLILIGLVAVGDVARLAGVPALATGSFLFGWLAIHQLGFAWRDRDDPGHPDHPLPVRRPAAIGLLLGGMAALLLLTVLGPYPVSMINLPGERLHNMSPPSLALLALATAQLGLILLLRARAERWLRRPRTWLVVVAVNSVVLTVFLWHVTAAVLVAGALDRLGLLPTARVGTPAWWLWRPPWLALLTVALAGLVLILGRFEWRTPGPGRALPRWAAGPIDAVGPDGNGRLRTVLAVAGYVAVIAGLLVNSVTPRAVPEPLGLPPAALVAYLIGAAVLRALRRIPGPRPGDPA